ncbi:MurR/RpiR family transcriptional regulator [Corynebacterium sp. A21]|uniref:MurR/RpiR family transcriptional regulator n=1 Tax=Corynebacterium sp. A21 TaxID=3457318 RepID=UPI003FD264EA
MTTSPEPGPGPILPLLRATLPSLTTSGRRIGEMILAAPEEMVQLTVSDVAAKTESSVGSVVRFCQDLGLRGFADLKLRLARETTSPAATAHGEVAAGDSPEMILDKVLAESQAAIASARGTLEVAAFGQAVTLLAGARKVLCVGTGTSAPLAQDIAYRFRTSGIEAEAPSDPHLQHVAARLLGTDTVCLAISHTGQTRETLQAVAAARQAGAGTVAITSFFHSPLTELVEVTLVAGSRETDYRLEAVASRIAHLAVLDALNAAITLASPDHTTEVERLVAEVLAEHRL